MIMEDHFFDHRDYVTGEPDSEATWTEWDFALAKAADLIERFTDGHGNVIWWSDNQDVDVQIVKKIDRVQARIDDRTGKKNYKPSKGEYWVSKLKPRYGDKMPTRRQWLDEKMSDHGN